MKKSSIAAVAVIGVSLVCCYPALGQNLATTQPESVGMSSARLDNLTQALLFRIFSMIKPIVAVAAMRLAEEGKLVLADPVSKYLPEFANMTVCDAGRNVDGTTVCTRVPADTPITLQDLMRHTSGIGYGETTTNSVIKQAYSDAGLYDAGSADYNQRRVLHSEELKGFRPLICHTSSQQASPTLLS